MRSGGEWSPEVFKQRQDNKPSVRRDRGEILLMSHLGKRPLKALPSLCFCDDQQGCMHLLSVYRVRDPSAREMVEGGGIGASITSLGRLPV